MRWKKTVCLNIFTDKKKYGRSDNAVKQYIALLNQQPWSVL